MGGPALCRAIGAGVASTCTRYNHATPHQIGCNGNLAAMPSYMAKVLRRATTLLVAKVGNKVDLFGLRKLT